ncbi:hypothetical protein EQU24_20020 [Methylotuvimicrobium buryatense]|uniref:Uncharacterized protein n=1 Tax=Methylotuvimicrobium buryatense TaxID=95641 RepID=A0A4P9UTM4_METBY|nr:hypothetical protein EQU24_20020 [Methylotuvimicrobium buryatense]
MVRPQWSINAGYRVNSSNSQFKDQKGCGVCLARISAATLYLYRSITLLSISSSRNINNLLKSACRQILRTDT